MLQLVLIPWHSGFQQCYCCWLLGFFGTTLLWRVLIATPRSAVIVITLERSQHQREGERVGESQLRSRRIHPIQGNRENIQITLLVESL